MYSNNCTVTISFPSSLSFGSSRKTKDCLLRCTYIFVCVSVILTLTFVPLLSIFYTMKSDSYMDHSTSYQVKYINLVTEGGYHVKNSTQSQKVIVNSILLQQS